MRRWSSEQAVFARRWAGFVSAMWLMQFSGTYSFPNYSAALKEVLGLDQRHLNRLSVAKDLGDSGGIIAGILSDHIPPWALLCIGACVAFLGYGTQWLVVSRTISPLPYWTIFLAAVMGGNSISWMNTAIFTSSVKNFPRNRGPVVGLFKAYMGLSAAIFALICDILFSSSPSMYLLMQVIIPSSFCLIAACFVCGVPPAETDQEEKQEKWSLFLFNIIASCMAVYIAIIYILPPQSGKLQTAVLCLLFVMVVAPVLVPVYLFFGIKSGTRQALKEEGMEQGLEENRSRGALKKDGIEQRFGESYAEEIRSPGALKKQRIDEQGLGGESTLEEGRRSLEANGCHVSEGDCVQQPLLIGSCKGSSKSRYGWCCSGCPPELGEDRKTLILFKSWDFYALYFTLFCGAGSGMTFSNNLGQIGQSFGFSSVTLFSSFFSLGNFLGRILSGNLSEYFLRLMGMPRPAWLGFAKLPMIAVFLWLATGSQLSLYVGSLILGYCHGSIITLTIPTVSEFYGLKHLGSNYSVTSTHVLAGSSLFSGVLAGYLYDLAAMKQLGSRWFPHLAANGSSTCSGASCYGLTLVILSALLAAALVLDGILTTFTRPLYRNLKIINTLFVGAHCCDASQSWDMLP